MSGVDDLLKRDEKRWEAGRRRAAGIEDRGLGPAIRCYYTRYLPAGALALAAAVAGTGLLASLEGPVDWELVATLGILCAAVGAGIGGIVYNRRWIAPAASAGRVDVMLSLDDAERKSLRRQIRGKEPIDPRWIDVTRAAAVQLRRGLATQLMLFPIQALIFLPQVMHWGGLFSWLFAAATLLMVAGLVYTYRDFLRTGECLARTQGIAPVA